MIKKIEELKDEKKFERENLRELVKQIRKEKRNKFPLVMRNGENLIIITPNTYKFYKLVSQDNNTNASDEIEMALGSGYKPLNLGVLE